MKSPETSFKEWEVCVGEEVKYNTKERARATHPDVSLRRFARTRSHTTVSKMFNLKHPPVII